MKPQQQQHITSHFIVYVDNSKSQHLYESMNYKLTSDVIFIFNFCKVSIDLLT